ncbi:hypothetical protein PHISCL_03049 [Aspergillus sclerotialis]|uniref:beta-glucosidase n=1 Tax=Aspergillus sclerotialis TaxID=2070753 RepID=A0A3A3A3L6_9EURO|nr:hypothetical protein PHISCL_03049 [Aspergillus sclerotialis]
MCLQDSPNGVRLTDYNTVFPTAQTAAATWDRHLIYERGLAMGQEHRQKGSIIQLGPVCGPLGRFPEGGRNWEGFSPDPVLTGVATAETIRGIQDAGVVACVKHFIGYEQEHFRIASEAVEYGYNITKAYSSNIDDKAMHELYLWPFADAVRAGVGSVMCSYNLVNNSYACQNSKILNGLLKDELGFQGFVVTDWPSSDSGVSSAMAGLDMDMPGSIEFTSGSAYFGPNLTLAVVNGTVPEWRIDDMAMRIMAAYFKVGREVGQDPAPNFDSWSLQTYGPIHFAVGEGIQQINWHVDVRSDHAKLVREIAADGVVLLKNTDGTLPLKKPKKLAVFGSDSGSNLNGPNGCVDRACDNGTFAMGWGSGAANFPYLITPDNALMSQTVQDGTAYQSIPKDSFYVSNIDTQESSTSFDFADTTSIVFVNAPSGEGYAVVEGAEGDRNNLALWHNGDELIRNISSVCPSTVVVIHSTGSVIIDEWKKNPNVTAIVWAGGPGEQSGNAIVDVLYGKVNPSGKSPFSWGSNRSQFPDVLYRPNNGDGAPQLDFEEGIFIDYFGLDKNNITPVYEFGYGLSYTTFEYSNIIVTKVHPDKGIPHHISNENGRTIAAPEFGNFSTSLADYIFPSAWRYVRKHIYPFITNDSGDAASQSSDYGQNASEFLPPKALDGSSRSLPAAGGGPGGNPNLYEVLYQVSATVTNTGDVAGKEVAQMYVSLGGPEDAKVQLRGFDKQMIPPGMSAQFTFDLTRRDLANWDTVSQNWVISEHPKTVFVGSSSRELPLRATFSV